MHVSSPATERSPAPTPRAEAGAPVLRDVPAVTRAVAILRLLADSPRPLGLHEIAKPLDLVRSTCLHILRVLVAEGLVAYDLVDKRYALSAGLLTLARPLLRPGSIGQKAQPQLDRIAREFNVTATVVQVIGLRHFVVIAVSRGEGIRLQIDVGSRSPALISATGRCVAAFGGHDPDDLLRPFEALRWDDPPRFERWLAEVEATRRQGYGVDEGHYIRGMTAIAAPVLDDRGNVTYCVTAVGMTDQIGRVGTRSVARELLGLVRQLGPSR